MNEYNVNLASATVQSASAGWLLKWHIGDTWLKSPGFLYNFMYDSYAEAIASALAKDLGIIMHVDYKLCILNIDGKRVMGCESKDFIKDNLTEITIEKLIHIGCLSGKYKGLQGYKQLIREMHTKFGLNIQSYLEDTILLDSITLNTDRHLWNMSILLDKNRKAHECKIYDSGNSLMINNCIDEIFYEDDMYSNGIKAEPFDLYFETQLKYIRNNRVYSGKLLNTYKILSLIKYNCLDTNNTFKVLNPFTETQLKHLVDLINKRYNTVIKNKAWINWTEQTR